MCIPGAIVADTGYLSLPITATTPGRYLVQGQRWPPPPTDSGQISDGHIRVRLLNPQQVPYFNNPLPENGQVPPQRPTKRYPNSIRVYASVSDEAGREPHDMVESLPLSATNHGSHVKNAADSKGSICSAGHTACKTICKTCTASQPRSGCNSTGYAVE